MSERESNVQVLQNIAKVILQTDNQEQIDAFINSLAVNLTAV